MPSRPHASHKGSFGEVAVIGSAPGMQGADLLAGRSCGDIQRIKPPSWPLTGMENQRRRHVMLKF